MERRPGCRGPAPAAAHEPGALRVTAGEDAASFFIPTDTWHVGAKGQTMLASMLADTLAPPASR